MLVLQNLVQETVARIVIVLDVASQTLLNEEDLIHGLKNIESGAVIPDKPLGSSRESIETTQVGFYVQIGIILQSNGEGRPIQREDRFVKGGEPGENLPGLKRLGNHKPSSKSLR